MRNVRDMLYRMSVRAVKPSIRIALLLLVVLVLVGGIAWQAQRSIDAQTETATAVLVDYAELAADEFARQAMAAVGYRGYYLTVNNLRSGGADNETAQPSPVHTVFTLDLAARSADVELVAIDDIIRQLEKPPPDSPFQTVHVIGDDQQHTYVFFRTETANVVSGFEVDASWLAATLQSILVDHPLLPESLGDGQFTNENLSLRFDDTTGSPLVAAGPDWPGAPVATKALTSEYGGIFDGHTIAVSIDPGMADALLIGGLPRSRLPELLAVLALVVVLLVVTIRQMQREAVLARLRNDFVAEVSHELRTPLTQIRMFTESLMLERMRTAGDRQRALGVIDRESRRLGNMVENILRFSRSSRREDELFFQTTRLAPLVASVAEEFRVLAEASGSRIDIDIDQQAEAVVDPDALRQILLNLLDNAVKYGPESQVIRVRLGVGDGFVSLSVADNGPGIPESERERIWDHYVRLDRERESAIAGTGIGLAVVHDLVSRHGGRVRIESSASGGARFVIELPS